MYIFYTIDIVNFIYIYIAKVYAEYKILYYIYILKILFIFTKYVRQIFFYHNLF